MTAYDHEELKTAVLQGALSDLTVVLFTCLHVMLSLYLNSASMLKIYQTALCLGVGMPPAMFYDKYVSEAMFRLTALCRL